VGRMPRIEFEGALYHVIQRGNNREFIFDRNSDKDYLLKRLVDGKKQLDFNLIGYVIMSNHYHLILQTFKDPLHKVMHFVNDAFAKYYNSSKERSGHVFQGRYTGILVQNERYALTLLRYVHQNPVRGGICQNVWEYPWSSDVYYRQNRQGFVDINLILDIFSDNREKAIASYKEFVQEQEEEPQDYSAMRVMGDEDFVAQYSAVEDKPPGVGLDEILFSTGVSTKEYELIKSGSRKRELTPYKKAFAREAHRQNYTLRQIAQHINLTESNISKMLK